VSFGLGPVGAPLPGFLITPSPTSGATAPEIINPVLANQVPGPSFTYTGGFANSGLLSLDAGSEPWDVTFNTTGACRARGSGDLATDAPPPLSGTVIAVCAIHGWQMSAKIKVINPKKDDTADYLAPHVVAKKLKAEVALAEVEALLGSRAILALARPFVLSPPRPTNARDSRGDALQPHQAQEQRDGARRLHRRLGRLQEDQVRHRLQPLRVRRLATEPRSAH